MIIVNTLDNRRQIEPEKIHLFLKAHGEANALREVNFRSEITCELEI